MIRTATPPTVAHSSEPIKSFEEKKRKNIEVNQQTNRQAGAELGQAQFKIGLDLNSNNMN